MEPGDIIRNRVTERNEANAQSAIEQREAEIIEFNNKAKKIADAIIATDYAGCSIYEFEGKEYAGIELYKDRHGEYKREMEGMLLHLLVDSNNQYQVILESSLTPEKPSYLYRLDYEGGVNYLEGTPFDPRTDQPDESQPVHEMMSSNIRRMETLIENFEKIKKDGPYKANEAWYRI